MDECCACGEGALRDDFASWTKVRARKSHEACDLFALIFEREVPGVEQVQLGVITRGHLGRPRDGVVGALRAVGRDHHAPDRGGLTGRHPGILLDRRR